MPGVSRGPRHYDREEREVEFSRALAFSDGVFGVAITLLITTIDVPKVTGPDLEHKLVNALKDLDGSMISYFISFAVIGLMWMHHHKLFGRIKRIDSGVLWLNLLSLAFIVLMPFSTELMGDYGEESVAVAIYALNVAAAMAAYTLLWWYCASHDLLDLPLNREQIRLELATRLFLITGFVASAPLAYVNPHWAQISWALISIAQGKLVGWLEGSGRMPNDGEGA
jgi:uncharacterized membrane protein